MVIGIGAVKHFSDSHEIDTACGGIILCQAQRFAQLFFEMLQVFLLFFIHTKLQSSDLKQGHFSVLSGCFHHIYYSGFFASADILTQYKLVSPAFLAGCLCGGISVRRHAE